MSIDNDIFNQEFADRIAQSCIEKFNSLGKCGKPIIGKEWTVLAGIVKVETVENGNTLEVVSLGTGCKCLGKSQLPLNGDRLHDSHAEIIARRAFKLYILDQIERTIDGDVSIFYIREGKILLKTTITFHFYCSNTPCGDASIFPANIFIEGDEIGGIIELNENLALNSPYIMFPSYQEHSTELNLKIEDSENETKVSSTPSKFRIDKTGAMIKDTLEYPVDNTSSMTKSDSLNHIVKKVKSNDESTCDTSSKNDEIPYCSLLLSDLHRTGAKCVPNGSMDAKGAGLEYHVTGVLRTKPGRGDPTLSHSCSDKMFKWTILGIQGALIMLFIENPIYIRSITIGSSLFSYEALERALSSRFKNLVSKVDIREPFAHCVPAILQTNAIDFPYRRYNSNIIEINSLKPSFSSVIWSQSSTHSNKSETGIDGKRIGTTKKNANCPKSRLSACRMQIFRKVYKLIEKMKTQGDIFPEKLSSLENFTQKGKNEETKPSKNYNDFKRSSLEYTKIRDILYHEVLINWIVKPDETSNFLLD